MHNAVLAIGALGVLAGCGAPSAGPPGSSASADRALIGRVTTTPTDESSDGRSGSSFAYPVSTTGGHALFTRAHGAKVNLIYGRHAGIQKSPQPQRQIAEPALRARVQVAPMAVSPTEAKIVSSPTEQSASIAKQPSNVGPETLGSDDVPPERNAAS